MPDITNAIANFNPPIFSLKDAVGPAIHDATALQNLQYQKQAQPVQLQHAQIQNQDAKIKLFQRADIGLLAQYKKLTSQGMSRDDAISALRPLVQQQKQNFLSSGIISPDEAKGIPDDFDPEAAQQHLEMNPDYIHAKIADAASRRADAYEANVSSQDANRKATIEYKNQALAERKRLDDARINQLRASAGKSNDANSRMFINKVAQLQRDRNAVEGNPNLTKEQQWAKIDTINQQIDDMFKSAQGMGVNMPGNLNTYNAPPPDKKVSDGLFNSHTEPATNKTEKTPLKGTKPTLSSAEQDWLNRAKQANPNASEEDLIEYGRSIKKLR